MDFERADFGTEGQKAAAATCAICQTPITGAYFTANGVMVCASCREQLAARPHGFEQTAFLRATVFGLGVAIVGSVVWYAISASTGSQFSLLSVAIGIFVGKAVTRGAEFRSGAVYQVLAVALTYLSIVSSYAPAIVKGAGEGASPITLAAIVLAAPFLIGFKNILGIVIIGFGLYEAWRYSRVPPIQISGPFELGK